MLKNYLTEKELHSLRSGRGSINRMQRKHKLNLLTLLSSPLPHSTCSTVRPDKNYFKRY